MPRILLSFIKVLYRFCEPGVCDEGLVRPMTSCEASLYRNKLIASGRTREADSGVLLGPQGHGRQNHIDITTGSY